MANDIGFASTAGLMSRESLASSLSNVASALPSSVGSDVQYLKMEKGSGDWLYGQEETLVDADSLWAVNPHSIQHGWVAWDSDAGGAPVQEIMVPASRPIPAEGSLPVLPQGVRGNQLAYKAQRSVQLVCIADPNADGKYTDVGVVCEYKQSSVGAMRLFKDLIDKLLERVHAGDEAIVPIAKLSHSSYKHDRYGKIINPVLEFVEWRAMDDTSSPAAEAAVVADEAVEEEEELAAEYAAAAAQEATPRRRARRD
jgi:hypothetical protein